MALSLGLHASRQLSDKVLRYLKRVIVTPAVYWSFAPLKRVFRYQYWAGFSGRSRPFDLAATCVFSKQSERPSHCDQPLTRLAPLLPKVQGKFAEFPRPDYRRHALGFSPRGTCVSSWYGHTRRPHRGFHGHRGSSEDRKRSYSRFHPVLAMTALPGVPRLNALASTFEPPRCVPRWAKTCAGPEY